MQDGLSLILNRIDKLSRQLRDGDDDVDETVQQTPQPFTLPAELERAFAGQAQQRYPDLSKVSLTQGLDSLLYYLDMVAKAPPKSVEKERRFNLIVLNLMKATWLLHITKYCSEYKAACAYKSDDAFEKRMMTWGMTVDKYIEKLEHVSIALKTCLEA
jgi:hypothetical protein